MLEPKRGQSEIPIEQIFEQIFEKEPVRQRFGRDRYARSSEPFGVSPEDSMPLFLSGEPDLADEQLAEPDLELHRKSLFSSRALKTTIFIAFAAAAIFGLLAVEDTRTVIANAKASLAGDPTPGPALARNPAVTLPPKIQAARDPKPSSAGPPTREAIVMAYQAALQGQQVQPASQGLQSLMAPQAQSPQPAAPQAQPLQSQAPQSQLSQSQLPPQSAAPQPPQPQASPREPPPAPARPVRRLDADELAGLLKRAKGLLAIGDLPAARLLLERAADAQEAEAALLLARSYDPQVLGASDMRSATPDPEKARLWYSKAAEFGSPDAQRRLAEIQK